MKKGNAFKVFLYKASFLYIFSEFVHFNSIYLFLKCFSNKVIFIFENNLFPIDLRIIIIHGLHVSLKTIVFKYGNGDCI